MEKKKDYERAKLEFVHFEGRDIITTSQFGESGYDNSGWTNTGNYDSSWS